MKWDKCVRIPGWFWVCSKPCKLGYPKLALHLLTPKYLNICVFPNSQFLLLFITIYYTLHIFVIQFFVDIFIFYLLTPPSFLLTFFTTIALFQYHLEVTYTASFSKKSKYCMTLLQYVDYSYRYGLLFFKNLNISNKRIRSLRSYV